MLKIGCKSINNFAPNKLEFNKRFKRFFNTSHGQDAFVIVIGFSFQIFKL